MFKDLPPSERPRERLLRHGPEALSLPELIALLLTTGTREKSVLDLSHDLLAHFASLEHLFDATLPELMEVKGIGQAKAIQLRAIFSIARRMNQAPNETTAPITTQEAYLIVRDLIGHQKQEVMVAVLKDVRGRLIHTEQIAIGTLSEVLVHPREVFYPAIRHKAHSLILAHNHPSGDPSPSRADLDLTRRLLESSRVMGIPLDDHLIICRHGYTSLISNIRNNL